MSEGLFPKTYLNYDYVFSYEGIILFLPMPVAKLSSVSMGARLPCQQFSNQQGQLEVGFLALEGEFHNHASL